MMRRAEELQDWICHVTMQPSTDDHLSLMLKNGQMLCMLANAIDPLANLKVNKLTTVFHSKANVNTFLNWCRKEGLSGTDLFETADILDTKDFNAVLNTLSILYDRFGGNSISKNPLSDTESSSGSPNTPSPKKQTSKLAAFMKAGFKMNRNRKGPKTPVTSGTPPPPGKNSTPPISPVGRPPMSPSKSTPPLSPRYASPPRSKPASGGNKLSAFLSQVPPSTANSSSLDHASSRRPAGPKKSAPKKNMRPKTSIESPRSPPTRQNHKPQEEPSRAPSAPASNNPRDKFASFVRSNPPASMKGSAKRNESSSQPPRSEPIKPLGTFEQKRAVFGNAISPEKSKPKPISAPAPASAPSGTTKNKLHDFMKQQPPTAATLSSAPVSSGGKQSKLAAFMATTGSAPSVPSSSSFSPPPVHVAQRRHQNQPVAKAKYSPAPSHQQQSRPVRASKIPFTLRRKACRSTGSGNYLQRRGTYWVSKRSVRSRFSLEEKRKEFMQNQLLLKEEELRRKEHGDNTKHNVILPGVQCYVPDPAQVWLLSKVMDFNQRSKKVKINATLDDGSTETRLVDLKDPEIIRALAGPSATSVDSLPIAIREDTLGNGVEDMRLLRYLNEPSILFNLKLRFEASKPYTYTNDIVIAVNPYKWIDEIYGDHLHEQYLHKARDSLSPHVYATSTAAYKQMTKSQTNQSILVSGESGAGKTETTKIVMNHLANVAGGRNDRTISKVIDVNPLLESFGNAKTTRNDNSSRFGKFTQLQFNPRGKLIGAKCEAYLLEKSRVVSIAKGERNYHIFYQILAGLSSKELKKELFLNSDYQYLYIGGTLKEMSIDGMNDQKLFTSTCQSLSLIGLSKQDQMILFRLLSGIIHLGEILFEGCGEENQSRIQNYDELSIISQMFGVEEEAIEHALCHRTVVTRNDAVVVPLGPIEAAENRDALAKTIYSKMFDWMVDKINEAISSNESEIDGQIGVLDIFGFEDFAHNGFEQFCINYANEKLQQKFTTDVFKTVEDEYLREGLDWDHIEYQDNKEIVDIIDGKMGIIALMNDHLRQPRGTEEALVNKFKTNHHKKGTIFSKHIDFPKVNRTQFMINHYAGSVTYETIGFMEKHRDTLQKDLLDLIQTTQVNLLMDFFIEKESSMIDSSNGTSPPRSHKAASTKSLGSQFKISLHRLMENISSTNTHYIRCIKPNANKSPIEFNKKMVVEQLRSAGVIEAIRITRSGYPSRLTPKELATRYCIMFPPSMHSPDYRRTCQIFMKAIGRKSPKEYQIGKSLVYFKNGVMEELEAMKSDFMYLEATCIQKIVLGFIERRRLARKIHAAIMIQSFSRMALEKNDFWLQRRAIITIQRGWRRYVEEGEPIQESFDYDNDEEHDIKEATPPSTPPARNGGGSGGGGMNRLQAFKTQMGDNNYADERSNAMKRMQNLNASAKSLSSSSNKEMEAENHQLRKENHRLKKEIELMREQCIELQSIILEINKSRKR